MLQGLSLSALEDSTLHPEINATLREELKEIYFSFKDSAGKPYKTLELVWRLEENTKKMYRTSNAKYILLELAKNYLAQGNTAKLLDTLYGDGVTETIGKAIYDYYDINWRDV